MARRTQPTCFAGRSQRAPTDWVREIFFAVALLPTGIKALVATIALSNQGIGETIRRTRGQVSVSAIAGGDRKLAMGMIVVSDLALAAGVASIPGPATDSNDDGWFVWTPNVSDRPAATAVEADVVEFDSKAMRRIEEGFGIAVMVENVSSVASLNVQMAFSFLASRS